MDEVLQSPSADNGVSRFVASLFRLDGLKPTNDRNPDEAALINDLKQEPVTLVLRNKDKPWSYYWNTREIYCTERTANLYDFPLFNVQGFATCQLPPERSGFLGMVSVLRATSPEANTQAFYKSNNNYHRVAATLYFVKGLQLAAATNGPVGDAKGMPLANCVPATDMRVNKEGLIFGTAAVPLAGATCAECHSPYNGPLSIAFRRFGEKGELLNLEDVDRPNDTQRGGFSTSYLKAILAEQHSCWRPEGTGAPTIFEG